MKNDNEEYAAVKNKKEKIVLEMMWILLIMVLYIFLTFWMLSKVPPESHTGVTVVVFLGLFTIGFLHGQKKKLVEQLEEELESMPQPQKQKKTEGYYVGDTYLERYIDDE